MSAFDNHPENRVAPNSGAKPFEQSATYSSGNTFYNAYHPTSSAVQESLADIFDEFGEIVSDELNSLTPEDFERYFNQ